MHHRVVYKHCIESKIYKNDWEVSYLADHQVTVT